MTNHPPPDRRIQWLFHLTCIGRGKSYRLTLRSKLTRLGIPFLSFTIIAILVKILFSSYVRRPVDVREIFNTFILFSSNPLGEMWFIVVLLILMSIYPLYRWLAARQALVWGGLAAVCVFFVVPHDIGIFQLGNIARMIPYFLIGIICNRYSIVEKYLSRPVSFWISLALFLAANVSGYVENILPEKPAFLVTSITGMLFSISLCTMLVKIRPGMFGSFSRYTFQIFLLGIFAQMTVRIFLLPYRTSAPGGISRIVCLECRSGDLFPGVHVENN